MNMKVPFTYIYLNIWCGNLHHICCCSCTVTLTSRFTLTLQIHLLPSYKSGVNKIMLYLFMFWRDVILHEIRDASTYHFDPILRLDKNSNSFLFLSSLRKGSKGYAETSCISYSIRAASKPRRATTSVPSWRKPCKVQEEDRFCAGITREVLYPIHRVELRALKMSANKRVGSN